MKMKMCMRMKVKIRGWILHQSNLSSRELKRQEPVEFEVQFKSMIHGTCLPDKQGEDNICNLAVLDETHMVQLLERRYHLGMIYTAANSICIAINPYRELDLPQKMESFVEIEKGFRGARPCHLFDISGGAIKGMTIDKQAQCIIVNGESGSGKTESVKLMLKHISELLCVARDSATSMAKTIGHVTDLLESFGNASTSRNINSSRFGKLQTLYFDGKEFRMSLQRGECTTYLLEKCRVVHQEDTSGERNFHIFYELLCRNSTEDCENNLELVGKSSADFNYTRYESLAPELTAHYAVRYTDTFSALNLLLLNTSLSANCVFCVLAAILHFGEEVIDPLLSKSDYESDCMIICARLFGISVAQLKHALSFRQVAVGGITTFVQLTADQSTSLRDAMSKALYERLFQWLVAKSNASCSSKGGDQKEQNTICLLDIFGFEVLAKNSLEQLCINFANEALQLRFSQDMIMAEQKEYEAEQIAWQEVPFASNKIVMELLVGRVGIFQLLNEACIIPGGSDDSYLNKLTYARATNSCFKLCSRHRGLFTIAHYAGDVAYDVHGFVDKNRDALLEHTITMFAQSNNALIVELFKSEGSDDPVKNQKQKGTIVGKFQVELKQLLCKVDATRIHFVRCVKPNSNMSSSEFDTHLVCHQIRCGGLVEAARVGRATYPYKMSVQECSRQSLTALHFHPHKTKLCAENLAQRLHLLECFNAKVGKTKVYFNIVDFQRLQNGCLETFKRSSRRLVSWWRWRCKIWRRRSFLRAVRCLQYKFRQYLKRKHLLSSINAVLKLQALLRGRRARAADISRTSAIRKLILWWKKMCYRNTPRTSCQNLILETITRTENDLICMKSTATQTDYEDGDWEWKKLVQAMKELRHSLFTSFAASLENENGDDFIISLATCTVVLLYINWK